MIKSAISFGWRQATPILRFVAWAGVRLARTVAPEVFPKPAAEPPPGKRPGDEPAPAPPPSTRARSRREPSATQREPSATRREPSAAHREPSATRRERPRRQEPTPPPRPRDPHHALNNPVTEPDPTEWPDPYDKREDPRDPDPSNPVPLGEVPHPPTGSTSTSEPHPDQDPEAPPRKGPTPQR